MQILSRILIAAFVLGLGANIAHHLLGGDEPLIPLPLFAILLIGLILLRLLSRRGRPQGSAGRRKPYRPVHHGETGGGLGEGGGGDGGGGDGGD